MADSMSFDENLVKLLTEKVSMMERRTASLERQREAANRLTERLRTRIAHVVLDLQRQDRMMRIHSIESKRGFGIHAGVCGYCEGTGGKQREPFSSHFAPLDFAAEHDELYMDPANGIESFCEHCIGVGHTLALNDEL